MRKFLLGLLAALTVLSAGASSSSTLDQSALQMVVGTGTNRVFKDEAGNSATLLIEACTLDFLSEDMRKQLYAARLHIDGKLYKACYLERNGTIMIIDQDQDTYGPMPAEMFRPVKEA